jgi:hypothetical protein
MKKIIFTLFLCVILTGCFGKNLTLSEKFLKNDYTKDGEQIFKKELKGGLTIIFYFDEENVANNYFEVDNEVYKIQYFYKKNISRIDECIYDFTTESLQTDNDTCQERINWLKIIKDPYIGELNRLNIPEEEIYILKKDLD